MGIQSVEDKLVVLVIEDDPDIQALIEDPLTDGGFDPAIAPSLEEAVTLLQSGLTNYRALVTDINLRGRSCTSPQPMAISGPHRAFPTAFF